MTRERHALVVGAGVIGLTSSYRLARAGWRVTLFDPSPASGATWAAAGMIAPVAEIAPGEQENFELQRGAVRAWRSMGEDLESIGAEAPFLHEVGTLLVGLDRGDRLLLDQFEGVARGFGATCQKVTREESAPMFTGVSARVTGGLYLAGDAWLDPDDVVTVFRRANAALGVSVVESRVERADTDGDRVVVETSNDTVRGDVGLLATGAAPLPAGIAERVANEVRPVRGVTIRVQGLDRSQAPTLRAYVRGRSWYLVSRAGGYCVMGASSEEQGELVLEIGELQRLLRDALDVVPGLESAGLLETRQGLRPASKDLSPFAEVVSDRWLWSSGHYRHGVTLAPLVATANVKLLEEMR